MPQRRTAKTALVTGATGGIGSRLCRLLAAEGWSLALHYNRRAGEARDLARRLEGLGARCALLRADLSRPGGAKGLVRGCLKAFGRLDLLVNNAGAVVGGGSLARLAEADWDKTLRLNAVSPFFLSREAFAAMARGGRIVNISSIAARSGGSERTIHYAAAKAALEALTAGLARLGAPRGILVNAVRPGIVDTPAGRLSGPARRSRLARIPLGRAAKPEEVARLVAFLAGPGGDYITGQVIPVTGGE